MRTPFVILGFALTLAGCRQAAREPVTLRYTYSWNEDRPRTRALLQQFSQETGTRVESLPIPEYTRDYVDLARKLLQSGSGSDLLNIDLIWSPILEPNLIDLRPYLQTELSQLEPQLLSSYTVNGKLVAVPFNVPLGALEYRPDLLRKYGYDHPPKTWVELESMAERIQAGERAKGAKDFWGYVWQGADGEALTCNALEWQIAAGGGRIIEEDRAISVNNPAAIQAWERAKRWIGRISPPSVVAYREVDSMLVFDSGKAAFNRIWLLTPMTATGQAKRIGWRSFNLPVVQTGFARMPGGPGGAAGTMGGTGTAVAMNSPHRQEAIALLKFQLRTLMEASEKGGSTSSGTQTHVVELSAVAPASGSKAATGQLSGIVARPSAVTGSAYKQVSGAYIEAVHSVLTGKREAAEAAAALEGKLIAITGFTKGAPKSTDNKTMR